MISAPSLPLQPSRASLPTGRAHARALLSAALLLAGAATATWADPGPGNTNDTQAAAPANPGPEAASSSEGLTLSAAQARLFQGNPDLAVLRLESDRAASQVKEAQADWLPSVDASGSYNFTTEAGRLRLDLPFPAPGGTSVDRALGDQDRVELGLDMSVPIFTGFSRGHAVEARQAQARAREAQVMAARDRMSFRLAGLFYGWQLARAQAAWLARAADHARELEAQLSGFVAAGTAVRSRALTAAARAKAAEVDRLAAENTRDSLALEVADFLGLAGEGPASPSGILALVPDTMPPPAPPWDGSEADSASASWPDDRVLEEGLAQARAGSLALRGRKLPQVHGMAGMRYANPGLNQTEDEFMAYGVAGLQLKWNLFDGFRNREQRRQLGIQEKVVAEQRRKLRLDRHKAMEGARLQHARWTAQLQAARAAREAARAAAADLARQLEAGLATEADLLEARNNEARADWQVEQAVILQKLAVLQWRHAAGKELRF